MILLLGNEGAYKMRDSNNQDIYDLLIRIDKGCLLTEEEQQRLSSVTSLKWHNIAKLPNSVRMLESLKRLEISNNTIRDISALANLTSLVQLDLSNTEVRDLSELLNLTSLSDLALCDTEVSNIDVLSNLTSLSYLNLSNTKVNDISALTNLTSLSFLNLRNTEVNNIDALTNLTLLQELNLGNTKVNDISALSGLKALKTLDLSGVEINDISALSGLTDLKLLNIQNSKITEIPESILELDLCFNTEKNDYFPWFSNDGIFIYGLTLIDQPIEIFSQGKELIREYYREVDQVPVNECKVIFLGDAESGKTYSIKRLLNKGELLEDFDGEATPGIEITVSPIKLAGTDISINYWDFGGQEIQHSMHRVFLTERTVYVVFLNARQDDLMDERARYWMENIKAFAPDAPVLVVINKIDQNEYPRFNERGFIDSYGNQIKKVIRLSAKEDEKQVFLDKLQGNINSIIIDLPTVSKKIPRPWKNLMGDVREMTDHYLTTEQFIKKCQAKNIKNYEEIHDELVDLFQVIGISFCYYKNRSVADYMLLNPKWMLNALYTIVTNGKTVAQNGVITQDNLYDLLEKKTVNGVTIRRVIPELRYKGFEVNYILGVIRMYGLSYSLGKDSEFFPMLCDGDEKISVKDVVPKDAIHFIFRYTYLPTNIMHRLIVEMLRNHDYQYVWYTGVVFEKNQQNQTAYIHTLGNDLHVYVYGEDKYYNLNEYLTPITNIVRNINKGMGISAEEYYTFRSNEAETEILREDLEGNIRREIYKRYDSRTKCVIDYRKMARRYNYKGSIFDAILQSIIKALEIMQNDCTYYRENNQNSKNLEDRRNRFVSGHLISAGYLCNDQQTGGTSTTGKSAGERDFVVKNRNGQDLLIYEGLNLKSLNIDYIDLHIKKLIDNYNPLGLKKSVLVTYLECKRENYLNFTDRYREHISEYTPKDYRCIGEPSDIPSSGQFLTCMVMNYEIGGLYFEIDHIIVRIAP